MSHPEIIRGKTRTGHMAHSEASGRVLSAGVLGDKCLFRKAPGGWSGSLPVRVSVWAPGRVALSQGIRGEIVSASALRTGDELGHHPEGFFRPGVFGDMWHSPREGPKGLSVWLSGHKAYFEGVFRLTFGTRGTLRGYVPKGVAKEISKGGFRAGFRDTRHSPKDGPEGVPTEVSKGHSAGLRDGSERAYWSGLGTHVRLRKGSEAE